MVSPLSLFSQEPIFLVGNPRHNFVVSVSLVRTTGRATGPLFAWVGKATFQAAGRCVRDGRRGPLLQERGSSVGDQYTTLPVPSATAIFKQLAEGGVLFSTDTEVYFGVNVIGARIWELLPPKTTTFDELCAVLASEYSDVSPQQIQKDVRKFLDDLVENGLVVNASANVGSHSSLPERRPEAQ